MRALTINEVQKFERGMNPKAAMGTGGINLGDIRAQKIEERDRRVSEISDDINNEWEEYLRNLLVGKRITTFMQRLAKFQKDTMKSISKSETKVFTINVTDVKQEKLSDGSLILAGDDNNIYSLSYHHDQKIYIE